MAECKHEVAGARWSKGVRSRHMVGLECLTCGAALFRPGEVETGVGLSMADEVAPTPAAELITRTRALCEAAKPGSAKEGQSAQDYSDVIAAGERELQNALPELLIELADELESALEQERQDGESLLTQAHADVILDGRSEAQRRCKVAERERDEARAECERLRSVRM